MSGTAEYTSNSPFVGWPLNEALARCVDRNISGDKRLEEIRTHLVNSRLVGWGAPTPDAKSAYLPPSEWKTLSLSDLNCSIQGDLPQDRSIHNLRIFPVVLSPNAALLLNGYTFANAFRQFVLCDPEVEVRGKKAMAIDSTLKHVYLAGRCYPAGVWDWPVDYEGKDLAGGRSTNSPLGFLNDKPAPQEVNEAATAICSRYGYLIQLLRLGRLIAKGDPKRPNDPPTILSSLWSHPRYYVDVRHGDFFEVNDEAKDWPDRITRRWTAIALETPATETISISVKSAIDDEEACSEWLAAEMSKSLDRRPLAKKAYKEQASRKWPNLTKLGFGSAWRAAIKRTGSKWDKAGAPNKEERRRRR
jgi:hypothetical protein